MQRDREYYARNREDILKRRHEARLKKQNDKPLPNDEQNVPHTPLAMSQGKYGHILHAYVLFR